MLKIMSEHHAPKILKSFSGFLSDGREVKESNHTFLYRLFHGYERVFAERPERFQKMLQLQLKPFDPRNG
jgi:hypothetical protein